MTVHVSVTFSYDEKATPRCDFVSPGVPLAGEMHCREVKDACLEAQALLEDIAKLPRDHYQRRMTRALLQAGFKMGMEHALLMNDVPPVDRIKLSA